MAWIKVTDPLGHPVWLSVEQIVRIRPYMAGIDFPGPTPDARAVHDHSDTVLAAKSIIDLVAGVQAVRETPDDVIDRIRRARKEDDQGKTAGV
jgi:hypothetical protein